VSSLPSPGANQGVKAIGINSLLRFFHIFTNVEFKDITYSIFP